MKIIYNPGKDTWEKLFKRPVPETKEIEEIVQHVFSEVQFHGDQAVLKYTQLFDQVSLENHIVSKREITAAKKLVSSELKAAIDLAKKNIEKFHAAQKTEKIMVETMTGVSCWQEKKAIQKVGLYIPGGTAPLFSTVLMLAIPAQIAGCPEIVLCTPPNKQGAIHPAILYAADLCGVTKILKIGGIQAIAALTFGTKSVPKVYKIFGPGNQFVTVAKQYAYNFKMAIDLPAGPSELMIVADDSAQASFVAADLLSQAEHGVDSQVLLISTSKNLLKQVKKKLKEQLGKLARKEIAEKALENANLVFVADAQTVLAMINEYAPEHLIICAENESFYAEGVNNAGSVFLGNQTPESAGDYASGTNHTLPTNGYAKQYSGVCLDSFLKSISFQKITKEGIKNIGPAIATMAEVEGLQAHKNAVLLRLNQLK